MLDVPSLWREFDRPTLAWRPLLKQLDEMFGDSTSGEGTTSFVPPCEVTEKADQYLLTFDIPGVKAEDLEIEVQGGRLLVSGERRTETHREEGKTRFSERRYGRFSRLLTLPEGVRPEHVEADYRDGVLRLAIAKPETARKTKIKIGESRPGGFFKNLIGGPATKEVKAEATTAAAEGAPRAH